LSDSAMYTAGQTANIQIQNTGGVDGKWDYVLRLYNDEELPIYEKQGTTQRLLPLCGIAFSSGPVGPDSESEQEIFFDLSDQLKSGNYRFELNGINTATGKIAFDYKRFMISGMEASVSVNTSKEIYKTNENVGISAMVGLSDSGMGQGGLIDAKAIIKIYSASPGWENIMHDRNMIAHKIVYPIAQKVNSCKSVIVGEAF